LPLNPGKLKVSEHLQVLVALALRHPEQKHDSNARQHNRSDLKELQQEIHRRRVRLIDQLEAEKQHYTNRRLCRRAFSSFEVPHSGGFSQCCASAVK
jgi:hypothetical protein